MNEEMIHTMTPEEEAEWERVMRLGGSVIDIKPSKRRQQQQRFARERPAPGRYAAAAKVFDLDETSAVDYLMKMRRI